MGALFSIEAFCGNGIILNFALRTRSELAASKLRDFGHVQTQQMNEKNRTKPFHVDFFRLKRLFWKLSNT